MTLPRSRLRVYLSTVRWTFSERADGRRAHAPDLLVVPTAADYFARRDPVLAAALARATPPAPRCSRWEEARVTRLLGRYAYGEDAVARVERRGAALWWDAQGGLAGPLCPRADGSLATHRGHLTLGFAPGPTPDGDRLLVRVGGKTRALRRLRPEERTPSELLRAGRIAEGVRALEDLHRRHPHHPAVRERRVNRIGYDLLGAGKVADAVALFALNTRLYPRSPNTWDSLGEAYLKTGDRVRARVSYQRALSLDPGFRSARQALDRLR